MRYTWVCSKRCDRPGLLGRTGRVNRSDPHLVCLWEAEMAKHDASEEDDKDDDSGKDDGKDISRHSVEHDKRTSTVPDPDDDK
jgi:hypothetical protein